jgi:hypothetical protein
MSTPGRNRTTPRKHGKTAISRCVFALYSALSADLQKVIDGWPLVPQEVRENSLVMVEEIAYLA